MTKYAFELSEELGCPVVVRSVCQLMMAQTVVSVDARETVPHKSEFAPNPGGSLCLSRAPCLL